MAAAWLLGVLVGLETSAPLTPLLLLLGGSVCMGLALRLRGLSSFPAILAAILLVGVWRADSVSGPLPGLTAQGTASVSLKGRIVSDPELSGARVGFTLDVRAADLGDGPVPAESKVLVWADPPDDLVSSRPPPYFDYGDLVSVSGRLDQPKPFGGFDYPAYLANQGISGIVFADSAVVTGEDGGWRAWPYSLRGRLSESIEDVLPYPQSALGQAMLLGQRSRLPPELVQDFRSTGTSHLLAISGLHVGVLVVMFVAAASWLFGRRGQYFLIVPFIAVWAYALVSGLPPSVVRAAIMGSVYLAAMALGRPGSILPALAFSAAAMSAISPEIVQRVSFQLSFAAVGGISLAQTVIPEWPRPETPNQPWVLKPLRPIGLALMISLAAALATWPLVAFNFQEVALLGVIVTVLALPAMPFIMVGTLVAAVLGMFSVVLGQWAGWLAWAPISYLIGLVEAAPGSTVQTGWAGGWLVIVWYSALAGLLLLMSPRRTRLLWERLGQWKAQSRSRQTSASLIGAMPVMFSAVVVAVGAAMIWWQVGSSGDGNLHVYFLDVGQGDSTLIVTPEGRQVLVDGGPATDSALSALSDVMPSNDRSLDLVVMTHLDADHSRGLIKVLDDYEVGAALTGVASPGPAMYAQWQAGVERNQVKVVPVSRGYQVDLGSGVTVEVLHPGPGPSFSDSGNNGSVVLRVTYGSISFLLTADIEAETESVLVSGDAGLESTVLKAAHHGSNTSSTAGFISGVNPTAVLVSVGGDNSYGHPSPAVMERLEKQTGAQNVYRTDLMGDVEFVTDGAELWVNTER
ncbi:MAG: DNA internalization-related competence protein ComEC/Rec2 [Chloroflexi bacterium]|nr:DNA internalization-related competence protein ComEC/Rec2 [Chloroflexota bacterium]MDA1270181.1 DNA internalization-related competence protein ComEC/Rec2 [Chloroflexota bacterium]